VRLSAADHRSLYVPPGCAHGFCVISADAEVEYLTTREYAPEHEEGVLWSDPAIGITWPIADPILSRRDQTWPLLARRATGASTTSGRT
jgi:dTDP-4-dehydrorhamnose 3,5-epimerase